MKFKVLFVVFNIVLFFSFLTVFFLPFFILDGSYMREFWAKNWYFCLIFLLILGIVNAAFILNWKILTFLEKEDWPALARFLEIEVFDRARLSSRKVRLLADSLILLGDFAAIHKLERLLAEKKPRLLGTLGTRFASAYLLEGNHAETFRFASEHEHDTGANGDWLSFYAGFARHLEKKFPEAAERTISLAANARDPMVTALAGYLCGELLPRALPDRAAELSQAGASAKARVSARYSRAAWDRYLEDEKTEMHVVILSKLTENLSTWAFAAPGAIR